MFATNSAVHLYLKNTVLSITTYLKNAVQCKQYSAVHYYLKNAVLCICILKIQCIEYVNNYSASLSLNVFSPTWKTNTSAPILEICNRICKVFAWPGILLQFCSWSSKCGAHTQPAIQPGKLFKGTISRFFLTLSFNKYYPLIYSLVVDQNIYKHWTWIRIQNFGPIWIRIQNLSLIWIRVLNLGPIWIRIKIF